MSSEAFLLGLWTALLCYLLTKREKKGEGEIELKEIKTSISKIKNTLYGLNSRSDITEE